MSEQLDDQAYTNFERLLANPRITWLDSKLPDAEKDSISVVFICEFNICHENSCEKQGV